MASTPAFAATVVVGSGLITGADTSLTAPTTTTTIVTAGSSGTKIEEIVFQGTGTTVASVLNVFRYDGTTYHLIDQVLITAVISSTTAVAFRAVRQYANLLLANGDTLRVSQTVSSSAADRLKVTAFGGSL